METCCLLGRGKLYLSAPAEIRSWGFDWGLSWGDSNSRSRAARFLGNVSRFSISIASQAFTPLITENSYSTKSEGPKIVTGMNVAMTLQCASNENIREALWGENTTQASLSDVDDAEYYAPELDGVFAEDSFISFEHPGVDIDSVTVIRGDTAATLVEDTHYSVSSSGITVLSDLALTGNSALKVSYSYEALITSTKTDPLQGESLPWQLTFEGVNANDATDLRKVKVYRARFQPLSEFPFIQQDSFLNIDLIGTLERDDTVTSGSKFFSIERIDP